jgi:hypothetical protein
MPLPPLPSKYGPVLRVLITPASFTDGAILVEEQDNKTIEKKTDVIHLRILIGTLLFEFYHLAPHNQGLGDRKKKHKQRLFDLE